MNQLNACPPNERLKFSRTALVYNSLPHSDRHNIVIVTSKH